MQSPQFATVPFGYDRGQVNRFIEELMHKLEFGNNNFLEKEEYVANSIEEIERQRACIMEEAVRDALQQKACIEDEIRIAEARLKRINDEIVKMKEKIANI